MLEKNMIEEQRNYELNQYLMDPDPCWNCGNEDGFHDNEEGKLTCDECGEIYQNQ